MTSVAKRDKKWRVGEGIFVDCFLSDVCSAIGFVKLVIPMLAEKKEKHY